MLLFVVRDSKIKYFRIFHKNLSQTEKKKKKTQNNPSSQNDERVPSSTFIMSLTSFA